MCRRPRANGRSREPKRRNMFVKLSAANQVTLEDRDNFRAFKLVIEGKPSLDDARGALAGTAELADKDTAWVSQAALRGRAEVVQDQAWQQSFAAMIEKAK